MPIYERMTIRGRGGALPTYQSQQTPYVPGQGINARVSGADAEILARGYNMEAKAMAGLVQAGKNAIDVGLQAADDYAKTKAVELATKYKMGMRQSMYGEGGILTREGENAFTANADTMKRSKELRAELLKDLDGSLVAQKFNAAIEPEEAEYSIKAQEYEGKQYRVFQDRTDQAAFSEAAEMAITGYADPKSFAKGTGEALWFQEQLLRRQGYSGEALERGLKESGSKIFAGGIEQALAADDLASARRLLAEGSREWRPALPHDLSKVGGVVEKGNIDIDNRKVEHRPDGSIATVESFSFNFDGVEVLIPTVIDGKKVSNDEAIAHFMKTGEHLGKFKTPEAATEYAIKLHENHAIQYGEARTRMTADDVAKAKKAIDAKAEALERKWEAEAERKAFESAVQDVTDIIASTKNDKSALDKVMAKAGEDEGKQKTYKKAWDSVVKQRAEDERRVKAAESSVFVQQVAQQVSGMNAAEFSAFLYTVEDSTQRKYAQAKWEEVHSNKPRLLVSEPAYLEAAYDDMLIGGMSAAEVAMKYVDHISDEDVAKLQQVEAKSQAEKAKTLESLKVELQTQTDIRNEYLNILGLGGKKLTEKQMGQKTSFLLQAQDALTRRAQELGRKLTGKEQREVYDSLIVVSKDRFFGADERAYENPEPEPRRPASLPDSALWLPKRVPASNKPNDKSTKVIWTWQYPDGSYVPETLLKKIKGEMNG